MNGNSSRPHRFSKSPPFLLPGLLVVIVILSFNYWRTSRLNKELLVRVSVSQENTQRWEKKYRDCVQTNEEKITSLQKEQREITRLCQTDKDVLDSEKNELVSSRDDCLKDLLKWKGDFKDVKEDFQQVQDHRSQLLSAQRETNQTVDFLKQEKKDLQAALSQQRKENAEIMSYIAEELGREGVEQLVSRHVTLPENFTFPSSDQQPNCYARAEQECKKRMQVPVQVVSPNENAPIQSPNVGIQNLQPHETDGGEPGDTQVQSLPSNPAIDAANPAGVNKVVANVAGNVDSVAGNVDRVAGNVDSVAGSVDSVAGNVDSVAGNVDSVAGNVDSVAGNPGLNGEEDNVIISNVPSDTLQDSSNNGGAQAPQDLGAGQPLPGQPGENQVADPLQTDKNMAEGTKSEDNGAEGAVNIEGDKERTVAEMSTAAAMPAKDLGEGYNMRSLDKDDDYTEDGDYHDDDDDDDDDDVQEYQDQQTYDNPQVMKGTPATKDLSKKEQLNFGEDDDDNTTPAEIISTDKTTRPPGV